MRDILSHSRETTRQKEPEAQRKKLERPRARHSYERRVKLQTQREIWKRRFRCCWCHIAGGNRGETPLQSEKRWLYIIAIWHFALRPLQLSVYIQPVLIHKRHDHLSRRSWESQSVLWEKKARYLLSRSLRVKASGKMISRVYHVLYIYICICLYVYSIYKQRSLYTYIYTL